MVSSDSSYHTGGPGVTEDDKASFEGRHHRDETTHMQSTGTGTTNVGSGSMGWGSMGATSTMTGGTLSATSGMDSSYSSGTMTGHDMGTTQSDTSTRMGSPGAAADVRTAQAASTGRDPHAERMHDASSETGVHGAAGSVGGMQQGSRHDSGSAQDTIEVLKDLIETCKDGEYGFQQCADHAKREDLRSMFRERAEDCRRGATQLQDHIRRLGGEVPDGGSMLGSVHRGWVATKAAMTSYDDKAMLEEAERGEDNALARYRKALQKPLPEPVRELVQRQCDGVQRNHDQVKRLRDQLRAQS
ncbi:PA2169 family four-helix-bundle protein [Ramlibacter rhizophilus]|uniref:PA2169 family four-helix-bundle protein n=2 Tax=Ramlibacter rhizophilus TaxID=1781167 RepID=A0A4Z0BNL4_9BURK|nr:PA2169 family four-helix-bundle protein [Ramlibacter rhizophilus]